MKTVSKLIDDIAGYLILGGLGAFFGSLALPEEWARHACLAGVTLLIAGLGLDAVLDTLKGKTEAGARTISFRDSPFAFIAAVANSISMIAILTIVTWNMHLGWGADGISADLRDYVFLEESVLALCLFILTDLVVSIHLGVITVGRRRRIKIDQEAQPFIFVVAVFMELIILYHFAWLFFNIDTLLG